MKVHPTPYRVDGEVGCFTFTTHGLGNEGAAPVHHLTGREFFPPLQGQQWYQTRGFKELALVHGVVEDSYRKTSALINRVRHQPEATSARQLCDTSAREGQQLLSHLEERADPLLAAHEVSGKGTPPAVRVSLSGCRADTLAEEKVQAAIGRCELAAELKGEMAANPLPYEMPAHQVYVAVDLVGVTQQKEHRPPTSTAPAKPGKPPQTYTTIAQVRNEEFSYVLAGKGVVGVLRLLLALLLHNALWVLRYRVDGCDATTCQSDGDRRCGAGEQLKGGAPWIMAVAGAPPAPRGGRGDVGCRGAL